MVKGQSTPQAQGAKPGIYYGYIVAIAASFILFAAYGLRFSYGVFFTPMSTELGWSSAMTSLAYSISSIIEGIFNIIMGAINDKYGPRIIITFSGILLGLGYGLMLTVHSAWQFFLFYGVIIGVGMGGIFVPLVSIIARWFAARRGLMTGLAMSGAGIGTLVLAPITDQLIKLIDWRMTFLLVGMAILIVVLIAAQFLKRDPAVMGLAPYGEDITKVQKVPAQGFSFQEALHTPQLWFAFFILICYGFISLSISIHIVPDAIKAGIPSTIAATILATMGGAQIAGRIGLGLAGDKIGNRLIFVTGFLLSAAALLWISSSEAVVTFFLFAAIFSILQGGISSSQSPLIARLFGLKSHGVIFGFCGFGYTIGAALGPFVTGYIFDRTGSYHLAFISCAIISTVALALTLFLRPLKNANFGVTKI